MLLILLGFARNIHRLWCVHTHTHSTPNTLTPKNTHTVVCCFCSCHLSLTFPLYASSNIKWFATFASKSDDVGAKHLCHREIGDILHYRIACLLSDVFSLFFCSHSISHFGSYCFSCSGHLFHSLSSYRLKESVFMFVQSKDLHWLQSIVMLVASSVLTQLIDFQTLCVSVVVCFFFFRANHFQH